MMIDWTKGITLKGISTNHVKLKKQQFIIGKKIKKMSNKINSSLSETKANELEIQLKILISWFFLT